MQAYLVDAGRIPYAEGLRLQTLVFDAKASGRLSRDVLFLLEHLPVITMGKLADESMLRASVQEITRQGIEFYHSTRGGRVTYHGLGQVVGYPIVDFTQRKQVLSALSEENYSEKLERVLVSVARTYVADVFKRDDKDLETDKRYVGAWCRRNDTIVKVGAVGWELRHANGRMISMHGFALNVNLLFPEHFDLIDPCGLKGVKAASLSELCGKPVEVSEVKERLAQEFANVFGYELEAISVEELVRQCTA